MRKIICIALLFVILNLFLNADFYVRYSDTTKILIKEGFDVKEIVRAPEYGSAEFWFGVNFFSIIIK